MDLIGTDLEDNVISSLTIVIGADTPQRVNFQGFDGITKLSFSRNSSCEEERHPEAIGTTIMLGTRPRTIYEVDMGITNATIIDRS